MSCTWGWGEEEGREGEEAEQGDHHQTLFCLFTHAFIIVFVRFFPRFCGVRCTPSSAVKLLCLFESIQMPLSSICISVSLCFRHNLFSFVLASNIFVVVVSGFSTASSVLSLRLLKRYSHVEV